MALLAVVFTIAFALANETGVAVLVPLPVADPLGETYIFRGCAYTQTLIKQKTKANPKPISFIVKQFIIRHLRDTQCPLKTNL